MGRRRGFSLVELLVVCFIVSLLINLGLAVAHQARETARAAQCMSHQRALFTGLQAYDLENGHLPLAMASRRQILDPLDVTGDLTLDPLCRWWFMDILDRTEPGWNQDPLRCPSKPMRDLIYGGNVLSANYGINLSLAQSHWQMAFYDAFRGTPASLGRLRQPGGTLLLVDSGYTVVSWWHAVSEPLDLHPQNKINQYREARSYIPGLSANRQRTNIMESFRDDALRGRHLGRRVNVTFADGHVQRVAADALGVDAETGEDGQTVYRNLSPLWKP